MFFKKIKVFVLILSVAMMVESCVAERSVYTTREKAMPEPGGSFSFQIFYDELSPYGSWVSYGNYGYVWAPGVGAGFFPYSTNGHWICTDYGWTWYSDYPWGWAPFHYGRWIYDNWYGWMWVPGYEWAPAWVVWGSYDTYYGWAPLPPKAHYGYYGPRKMPPSSHWTFVPNRNITDVNLSVHVVRQSGISRKVNIIDNSGDYHGQKFYRGPRVDQVERNTGRNINTLPVAEKDKPGESRVENNKVELFRPNIQRSRNAAPPKVQQLEDIQRTNVPKRNREAGHEQVQPQRLQPANRRPDIQKRNQEIQREPLNPPQRPQHPQRQVPQQKRNLEQKQTPGQRQMPSPQKQAPERHNLHPQIRQAPNDGPAEHQQKQQLNENRQQNIQRDQRPIRRPPEQYHRQQPEERGHQQPIRPIPQRHPENRQRPH